MPGGTRLACASSNAGHNSAPFVVLAFEVHVVRIVLPIPFNHFLFVGSDETIPQTSFGYMPAKTRLNGPPERVSCQEIRRGHARVAECRVKFGSYPAGIPARPGDQPIPARS